MSNKIESKIPAWLMELSEQEQQAVAGGLHEVCLAIFLFSRQTSAVLQKIKSIF